MNAQDLVETGVTLLAGQRGAVLVEAATTANLRWANSSLTTNGVATTRRVHVVVHPELAGGSATGTASGMVHDRADLESLLARARAAAQDAGPAQDRAPEVPARPASPDWDAAPGSTGPDALAPVTALLSQALPDRRAELFGYAEHDVTTTYLGTSAGLRLRHEQPSARFELCGKSHGRTRSAWAGRSGRHLADLDLVSTPDEVRRGLQAQARQVQVAATPQMVVLSPSAAADMLVYLWWSAGLRDAVEGRSAFSGPAGTTRLGERVSLVPFWMRSDPDAPGLQCADHALATESSPVTSAFDLGLPVPAADWLSEGRITGLMSTRHSAGAAGLAPTPTADNLLAGVAGATGGLDELAQRVGDGLVVTCLWYIREVEAQTLLLTGLTRDGVYVVRGGEVIGACGNFRFNESPLGMLARIRDAGAPVDCLPREWADWVTRARVAPLAVDGFGLSTASEAV